ncbi:MAG: hypothetical protein H7Z14_09355, partial [Anaerolineae bacterium]|nr:hypothetical protein [Phycisphaerae bacterium]
NTTLATLKSPLPRGGGAPPAGCAPTAATWRATSLLPDGFYRATLPAGSTRDRAGNVLGAPVVLNFRVFRGDADGNGIIDFDDYSHIDNGFNNNRTGFSNGDFDYNGIVDFDDYSLIDQAFNHQRRMSRARHGK